jgi:hypothetical protein
VTSKKTFITLALLVAALALPASASAASATVEGYGGPAGVQQVDVAGVTEAPAAKPEAVTESAPAPATTVRTAPVSQLPFTGFDVLLVLAAGGLLIGVGFALRRLARTARATEAS